MPACCRRRRRRRPPPFAAPPPPRAHIVFRSQRRPARRTPRIAQPSPGAPTSPGRVRPRDPSRRHRCRQPPAPRPGARPTLRTHLSTFAQIVGLVKLISSSINWCGIEDTLRVFAGARRGDGRRVCRVRGGGRPALRRLRGDALLRPRPPAPALEDAPPALQALQGVPRRRAGPPPGGDAGPARGRGRAAGGGAGRGARAGLARRLPGLPGAAALRRRGRRLRALRLAPVRRRRLRAQRCAQGRVRRHGRVERRQGAHQQRGRAVAPDVRGGAGAAPAVAARRRARPLGARLRARVALRAATRQPALGRRPERRGAARAGLLRRRRALHRGRGHARLRRHAGERPRGAAGRAGVRGHLRLGVAAGAQLPAQLLQELHGRRRHPDPHGSAGEARGAPVHLVHGRAVGHGQPTPPPARDQVLLVPLRQMRGPHRVRDVLQCATVPHGGVRGRGGAAKACGAAGVDARAGGGPGRHAVGVHRVHAPHARLRRFPRPRGGGDGAGVAAARRRRLVRALPGALGRRRVAAGARPLLPVGRAPGAGAAAGRRRARAGGRLRRPAAPQGSPVQAPAQALRQARARGAPRARAAALRAARGAGGGRAAPGHGRQRRPLPPARDARGIEAPAGGLAGAAVPRAGLPARGPDRAPGGAQPARPQRALAGRARGDGRGLPALTPTTSSPLPLYCHFGVRRWA